jgi:hypothetical protein
MLPLCAAVLLLSARECWLVWRVPAGGAELDAAKERNVS